METNVFEQIKEMLEELINQKTVDEMATAFFIEYMSERMLKNMDDEEIKNIAREAGRKANIAIDAFIDGYNESLSEDNLTNPKEDNEDGKEEVVF